MQFWVGEHQVQLARINLYKNHSSSSPELHIVDLAQPPYAAVLFIDAALLLEKCALGRLSSSLFAVLSCRSVVSPR
jgi:hypothetical protein